MKTWHLDLIRDPIDHSSFELEAFEMDGNEVLEGVLRSNNSAYPVTRGIPRFVANEGYSANFGWQWQKWAKVQYEEENLGGAMEGWTTKMFQEATQLSDFAIHEKLVLEVGCGGGRFADRVIEKGGTVIALDYSSAVDVARDLLYEKSPDSLFIQGDALNLPLANDSVDEGYSIGVLHHTPEPLAGVREAHRVIKRGGRFALSVYPKGGYYGWPNVSLWRKIFNSLPPEKKNKAALAYSEFFCRSLQPIADLWRPLTYPIRAIFPTVYLPDIRWSILDTFDSITTSYQSTHTYEELKVWFESAGFVDIFEGTWGCNAIGKKS